MSLNIGNGFSRFVTVKNTTIRPNFSEKVLFADLVTSRKTARPKIDKETGNAVVNPDTGEEVLQREFSNWKARFIGNAFETAKLLQNGDKIDITSGWIENVYDDKQKRAFLSVIITDFVLSTIDDEIEK